MRSYGMPYWPKSAPAGAWFLLDRVYALENRGQATGIASVFSARFSGEPPRAAQGSLENRRFRPAVLWRTVRFPDTSARPGRNSASRPGRNAPVFGPQPVAFSIRTWPGEPGTKRIRRAGFLETTAEDFAIVASATTLEAENRRSETDPPAFRIGNDPRRTPIATGRTLRAPSVFNRNGRSSAHSTDGARPGGAGYAWRERYDRKPMAQFGRGRVECRSIAATSARSS